MNAHGYAVSVSLRVWHPELAPDRVSAELGVVPTASWAAGDRHGDRVRTETYWTARLPVPPEPGLREAVRGAADWLLPHASFLREVSATGGRGELFVGVFLDRDAADTLPASVLGVLAELRVDLTLDLYGPRPPDADAR